MTSVHEGWWVKLEGEERDLRDLSAHFRDPELEVVEDESAFYLSSSDFARIKTPDAVRQRGRALVAVAAGALHIEFGRFQPPAAVAVIRVDEQGTKQHFIHVSSALRMHAEVNARITRTRPDGSVEIVDLVAPPVQTAEWAHLARRDPDVENVLAILGRDDVRWHDLVVRGWLEVKAPPASSREVIVEVRAPRDRAVDVSDHIS